MKPVDLYKISSYEIGGWISPDGSLYKAEYTEHDEVAAQIVSQVLGVNVYYAGSYLVDSGWIRLETNGYINHGFRATDQQASMLCNIYDYASGYDYKYQLRMCIAPLLREAMQAIKEPMPAVPGQGDQENYRRAYAW